MALKVLFTIAGLHPESGGPSRSVPLLCENLALQGLQVEIVSHHYGPASAPPLTPPEPRVRTTFVDCSSPFGRRVQWTPRFKAALRDRCRDFQPQIIHDTGLWLSTNHAAAVVAFQMKLPRIVSPRGMLSAWALQHKGWKKRLAWQIYQARDLRTATLLHATSDEETSTFRDAGLRQPVACIPNGVDIPALPDRSASRPKTRTVLFLGRIHPIKGLLNLVHAWAQVRPSGWRLMIVGRDELDHASELRRAIGACSLDNEVIISPPVDGMEKARLYAAADLFVLPSHSENFGIVVAEALAYGLPVITTKGTPWQELEKHRCGWWAEIGAEPLAAALREGMALDDNRRHEMGRRGRQLVETQYGWPGIAARMHVAYRWLLGLETRPGFVV